MDSHPAVRESLLVTLQFAGLVFLPFTVLYLQCANLCLDGMENPFIFKVGFSLSSIADSE